MRREDDGRRDDLRRLGGKVENGVETNADEVDERDLDDRAHAGHRSTCGDADSCLKQTVHLSRGLCCFPPTSSIWRSNA